MRFNKVFIFLILLIVTSCKSSDENTITSLEDLGGHNVAVCTGSTQDQFLEKEYPDVVPFRVDCVSDVIAPLLSGQASAALSEGLVSKALVKENPLLYVTKDTLFIERLGFIFKNEILRDDFNLFLTELTNSGELEKIIDKWDNIDDSTIADQLDYSGEKGNLSIMSDIQVPFFLKKNGEFCGIDVDILSKYCAARGYLPKFNTIPFASGLIAVSSGKIDAYCGGVTITEERKKKMHFSEPYHISDTRLILINRSSDSDNSNDTGSFISDRWDKISESFKNNLIKEDRYKLILDGLDVTLIVSFLSAILGTLLGMLICWMRMSKNKLLKGIARTYIEILRGIPHLVLLMLMFYVVFASSNLEGTIVASITFAMNFAAYASEIFRSAIDSIDKGQKEAGVALGFSGFQTFYYIIVPQAIRRILPIYKGELVSLVKMTSIIGYIAVQDLTKSGDIIRSRTFDAFFPLIFVAIIYFVLSYIVSKSISLIEKKYERNN